MYNERVFLFWTMYIELIIGILQEMGHFSRNIS